MTSLALSVLIGSSFLQKTRTPSWINSKFEKIRQRTAKLAAIEDMGKSQYTFNGENIVASLAPSFFIGSSSFLQVRRTCLIAWKSSWFGQIKSFTTE